jgi:hypothetical protein
MKKKTSLQCLGWSLNDLGSSQNGQNSLIHNWCIGGCWFTQVEETAHTRLIPKQNPLGIRNLGFLLFCWPCLPR